MKRITAVIAGLIALFVVLLWGRFQRTAGELTDHKGILAEDARHRHDVPSAPDLEKAPDPITKSVTSPSEKEALQRQGGLQVLQGDLSSLTPNELLDEWNKLDLTNGSDERTRQLRLEILSAMGAADPRRALDFAIAEGLEDDEEFRKRMAGILRAWVFPDHKGAIAWLDAQIEKGNLDDPGLEGRFDLFVRCEGSIARFFLHQGWIDELRDRLGAVPEENRERVIILAARKATEPFWPYYIQLLRDVLPAEHGTRQVALVLGSETFSVDKLPTVSERYVKFGATSEEVRYSVSSCLSSIAYAIGSERVITVDEVVAMREFAVSHGYDQITVLVANIFRLAAQARRKGAFDETLAVLREYQAEAKDPGLVEAFRGRITRPEYRTKAARIDAMGREVEP